MDDLRQIANYPKSLSARIGKCVYAPLTVGVAQTPVRNWRPPLAASIFLREVM